MSNDYQGPDRRDPAAAAADDARLLQQVRAVLTPMPSVDRRAIADILTAVAARRPSRAERVREYIRFTFERWHMATTPLARGTALVVTALLVGFVTRGALPIGQGDRADTSALVATQSAPAAGDRGAGAAPLQVVEGAGDPAARLVPVQFVLDARTVSDATTLSVVGDFNGWDLAATPMTRDGDVWSVALPVTPGRHVYAFVINGTRWIADPRAPQAVDADFGRPGSVIIVQTP